MHAAGVAIVKFPHLVPSGHAIVVFGTIIGDTNELGHEYCITELLPELHSSATPQEFAPPVEARIVSIPGIDGASASSLSLHVNVVVIGAQLVFWLLHAGVGQAT